MVQNYRRKRKIFGPDEHQLLNGFLHQDLTSYLYESTFGFNSWDLHRQAQKKKKEDLAADPLKPAFPLDEP